MVEMINEPVPVILCAYGIHSELVSQYTWLQYTVWHAAKRTINHREP